MSLRVASTTSLAFRFSFEALESPIRSDRSDEHVLFHAWFQPHSHTLIQCKVSFGGNHPRNAAVPTSCSGGVREQFLRNALRCEADPGGIAPVTVSRARVRARRTSPQF